MNDPRLAPVTRGQEDHAIAVNSPLLNRFWVASLAFQRARQLNHGARPRLEADGHNHVRVALLEVIAGLVSGEIGVPPTRLENEGGPG